MEGLGIAVCVVLWCGAGEDSMKQSGLKDARRGLGAELNFASSAPRRANARLTAAAILALP